MKWIEFGRDRRQRMEILQLTSLLNRWCQVRENLMYAFERCLDSPLSPSLNRAIQDLLTRIRGGMPPDQALEMFQAYSDLESFQDLVIALRFNFRHRGRLPALLELLEIQQNKLEEAQNDRRIGNRSDLILAVLLTGAVPILFGIRLASSAETRQLFLKQATGPLLLVLAALAYAGAVLVLTRAYRQIRS